MRHKRTYLLMGIVSMLLLGLLVNQIIYVYRAAIEQEAHFNEKASMALESIVNDVSEDYQVCQSVNDYCLGDDSNSSCKATFESQDEWQSVDSIIRTELRASNIDLKYRFDFCKSSNFKNYPINTKNTFTSDLKGPIPSSAGIMMHLEFPSKSNYIMRQMGLPFLSSVLMILLISIVFVVTLQYYRKERENAARTRDFLNNMTHEFKTPLSNIAFANNMLSRQSDKIEPEKIKKYTNIIRSESEKIIDSSEDILELAKQEYDFGQMALENVDVHDIIHDLQRSFRTTFEESGAKIKTDLSAYSFTVRGKTSFLYNALSNLMDNAIKYCNTEPRLELSTFNKSGNLFITLADNGIGIPKKEKRSVFEKFYRVSTGDRHDVKGFGLGLSYVKMIIEQMKGSVSVDSELYKGSVFTIKLPIIDV